MNTHKNNGRLSKYGRMSATGNEKNDVIYSPTLKVTKTMIKMYPIGDVK